MADERLRVEIKVDDNWKELADLFAHVSNIIGGPVGTEGAYQGAPSRPWGPITDLGPLPKP